MRAEGGLKAEVPKIAFGEPMKGQGSRRESERERERERARERQSVREREREMPPK